MEKSKKVYSFRPFTLHGCTFLEAQEWPWTVAQIVPTTPDNRARVLAALKDIHGTVAEHDSDKSFFVVQACSGDQDGKHPERHLYIDQANYKDFLAAMRDTLAQAAVWYETNIIDNL